MGLFGLECLFMKNLMFLIASLLIASMVEGEYLLKDVNDTKFNEDGCSNKRATFIDSSILIKEENCGCTKNNVHGEVVLTLHNMTSISRIEVKNVDTVRITNITNIPNITSITIITKDTMNLGNITVTLNNGTGSNGKTCEFISPSTVTNLFTTDTPGTYKAAWRCNDQMASTITFKAKGSIALCNVLIFAMNDTKVDKDSSTNKKNVMAISLSWKILLAALLASVTATIGVDRI